MRSLITEAHLGKRDGNGSPLHLMTLPAVADMATSFLKEELINY